MPVSSSTHLKRSITTKKILLPVAILLAIGGFSFGFLSGSYYPKVLGKQTTYQKVQQKVTNTNQESDQSLRKYSLQNIQNYPFQISEITLEKVIEKQPGYTGYLFSYKTVGKKMTGQINIPNTNKVDPFPIILMVRGYVDQTEFKTGSGTKFTAAEFAKAGYVTIAPDFLGFGGSSPAGPGWEERFEKPVNVIELIKSLRQHRELAFKKDIYKINPDQMGMWAHSNGGQITLSTLEALGEPIPATMWAPVTAPFPYSVLFYSDEMDDGGKGMRSAVAGFEQKYNVQEYSLTQYFNRLQGPLQLHQGSLDDAVPLKWSDDFVKSIGLENKRREEVKEQQEVERLAKKLRIEQALQASAATTATRSANTPPNTASPSSSPSPSLSPLSVINATKSAQPVVATNSGTKILADAPSTIIQEISTNLVAQDAFLQPIDISYFVYKGADHGLFPNREEAVARDLRFFAEHLKAR